MTEAAPIPAPAYSGPRRILSGIQASGALHLGNYLGALKRFTQLQDTGAPCFLFVADLHAITVWQDPALLTAQTREIAAAYLASGLDPARSVIFPQSAMSRVSSRCCFWSSPVGTSVALYSRMSAACSTG